MEKNRGTMADFQKVVTKYVSGLRPSSNELQIARERRDLAIKALNESNFPYARLRQSGSLAKVTSLSPIMDVDMIAWMKQGTSKKVASKTIGTLSSDLSSFFSNRKDVTIHRNAFCTTIEFSGPPSVDIVPGIMLDSKGRKGEIRHRRQGHWFTTSPTLQQEHLQKLSSQSKNTKNMILIAKAWGKHRKSKYGSYAMELLVEKAFSKNGRYLVPASWALCFDRFFIGVEKWAKSTEPLRDWGNKSNNVAKTWSPKMRLRLENSAKNDFNRMQQISKLKNISNEEHRKLLSKIIG